MRSTNWLAEVARRAPGPVPWAGMRLAALAPANFPNWNSAVQAVDTITARGDNDVGSTYLMERNLPIGRAANELEIVSRKRPTEFAIRTTSGPTPFHCKSKFRRTRQ
jgi:hypothetical protein